MKTDRKPITIYIKEEIIRALEPGARTKLRQLIENGQIKNNGKTPNT